MTTQAKPSKKKTQIKKPENFDLEKGRETALRIIRENEEWVKEMAKK
jgi:hypothetical protein